MQNIRLEIATPEDKSMLVAMDYLLSKNEHIELNREEKITQAIVNKECFLILVENNKAGFILMDYRFFDQGWIELMIIHEALRGKGIGTMALKLAGSKCIAPKLFTSTNSSNLPMQKALSKAGFQYSGELLGLDEDDPELFYYKVC